MNASQERYSTGMETTEVKLAGLQRIVGGALLLVEVMKTLQVGTPKIQVHFM